MGTQRKGYQKKPKYIYWLSLLYFVIPFVSLYQLYLNVDQSIPLLKKIFFSQFFLLESFLSFSAGLAVLLVNKLGFLYVLALSFYAMSLKIYHLQTAYLFESPIDFIVALFWFVTTILLLFTAIRIPFLNPNQRWWQQPPRYAHQMKGYLRYQNYLFAVTTLNISLGGLFVKIDESKSSNGDPYPFSLGKITNVEINTVEESKGIFSKRKITAPAKIVWCSKKENAGQYGMGLQFVECSNDFKARIKKYIELLKSLRLTEALR